MQAAGHRYVERHAQHYLQARLPRVAHHHQPLDREFRCEFADAVQHHLRQRRLGNGHAAAALELWAHHGLLEHLAAPAQKFVAQENGDRIDHDVAVVAPDFDRRHRDDVAALGTPRVQGRVDLLLGRHVLDVDDALRARQNESAGDPQRHLLGGGQDQDALRADTLQDAQHLARVRVVVKHRRLHRLDGAAFPLGRAAGENLLPLNEQPIVDNGVDVVFPGNELRAKALPGTALADQSGHLNPAQRPHHAAQHAAYANHGRTPRRCRCVHRRPAAGRRVGARRRRRRGRPPRRRSGARWSGARAPAGGLRWPRHARR